MSVSGEMMAVHTADEHETKLGTNQVVRTTVIPGVDIVHGFLNNKNLRISFEQYSGQTEKLFLTDSKMRQ